LFAYPAGAIIQAYLIGRSKASDQELLGGVLMNIALARVVFIGLALALFLFGCGSNPVISTTATPIRQATLPPTSPTPTTPPGPLPTDIVVYPGAQLVVEQRIATGILYFYRVMAATDTVTAFYTDQMPKQGWTQQSEEQDNAHGTFLVYTKDTRSVMLNIVPDPIMATQTDISITLSNS